MYFYLYLSVNRFEMQYHLCLCQERHVWRVSWTCLLVQFGRFCVFGSVLLILSVFQSKDVWNTVLFALVSRKALMESMLLIILYRAHTCSIISARLRRCLWGVSTIFYTHRFFCFCCRVKLAYNVKTGEAVAVKIIDTNGEKAAVWDDVRKEVALTSNGVLTYKLVTQWYRPARRYIIPYRYCICFLQTWVWVLYLNFTDLHTGP